MNLVYISVLAVPTTVTYFTMYEQLKVMLTDLRQSRLPSSSQSPAPSWVSLTAGGLARLVAVSLVSPLELVRTKMQSQKMPWSQVIRCVRDLVTTQGVRGLWNGYTATLLRDVPFSALYWPLYESTRDSLRRWAAIRERRSLYTLTVQENSFLINFVSGALAGSVASTITLPFDVIKTIKQIEMGEKIMKVSGASQTRTNITIARELIADQGVRSLFSGMKKEMINYCRFYNLSPFHSRSDTTIVKSCSCLCHHDIKLRILQRFLREAKQTLKSKKHLI